MATHTTYYNLTKPAQNDKVNIGVLNDNADIIDTALHHKVDSDDLTANNVMMSDGITSVEDAVTYLIPKTVKSVTADGIKTYAQLFVDLANLGAGGNALKIGSLTFSMVNQLNYFSCYFSGSNIIDILSIYMTTSTAVYKGVAINNTGAVTWVDMSNDVPTSGTKIEKIIL